MRRTALAAGGFFLLSLIVYNLNLRCVASLDSRGARLIPLALLTGGTLHLDRLEALFPEGPDYWYTRSASGHLVSGYPVVVPLLLPAVFALTLAYGVAVQAIGAFCFPMGGSTRTLEVWRLDRIQYLVELRGGLAPIEFRPTFRAPNVIW